MRNLSDLERDEDHGVWTLGGGLPRAVPDGVLGLQGEQETRGEVLHLQDAGVCLGRVLIIKVPMDITDDIINYGEEEP